MDDRVLTEARGTGPESPRRAVRRASSRRLGRLVLAGCASVLGLSDTARGDREGTSSASVIEKATAGPLATHVRFSVTASDPPTASASPLQLGSCSYEARQQEFRLTSATSLRGVVTSVPSWDWTPAGQSRADDALQGGAYVVVLGGRPPTWQTVYPSGVMTETARAFRDALSRQVLGKSLFDLSSAALVLGNGAAPSSAALDVEFSVDSLELDIGVASTVSGHVTKAPGHVVVAFQSGMFAPMWPDADGVYAARPFAYGVVARGIVRSVGDGGIEARFDVRVHHAEGEATRFFVDATWIVRDSDLSAPGPVPEGRGNGPLQGARVLVEDADSAALRIVGATFDSGSDTWVVPTLSLLKCTAVSGVDPFGVVRPLAELVATERRGHLVVLRSSPLTQGKLPSIGGDSGGPPVATMLGSSKRPISAAVVHFATLRDRVLGQVWGVAGNTESARAGLPAVDASGTVVGVMLSDSSSTPETGMAPIDGAIVGAPFQFVASGRSLLDHLRTLGSDEGPLHALGAEDSADNVAPASPEEHLSSVGRRALLHPRSAPLHLALARTEAAFGSLEAAVESDDTANTLFPAVRVPGLLNVLRAMRLRERRLSTPSERAQLEALSERAWIQVPGNDDAKIVYASACVATGRLLRAARILDLVPATSSDGCRARVDLATRLERTESPIDTLGLWRAACAAIPPCEGSVVGLLSALERTGRTEDLLESLDAMRPAWRRDVGAVESVLRCALIRGTPADVSTWYENWLAMSPPRARIPLLNGRVLAVRGDVAAATSELRRASVVNAQDLDSMAQIATVLIQIRSFALAEEVIQAVQKLDAPTGQQLRLQLDRKRPPGGTR